MPHDEFRHFIDGREEFLILSHVDPDGDAIGSSLGLAWALRALGKKVVTANESPLPDGLRFLPGSEWVKQPAQVARTFDAAFVLDCSSLDRVGPNAAGLVAPHAQVANVDHHAANDGFGNPKLVNVEASATAELVHEILESYGAPIGPEMAECLMSGSRPTPARSATRTPPPGRSASRRGWWSAALVPRSRPTRSTDESRKRSLRILGSALESLEKRGGGQVGALTISRDMFEKAHATPEDADGIVQFAKSLDGARVGVLIQEVAPGEVRLSFRSDGTLDVNEIAGRFGGRRTSKRGGCPRARRTGEGAGAVLDALDRAVNGGPPPPRG